MVALELTPPSLYITIGPGQAEVAREVTVTGVLVDGTGVDLTAHAQTTYVSDNIGVAFAGAQPGQVLGVGSGETTVNIGAAGLEVALPVTVASTSPVPLGAVKLPGDVSRVALVGDRVYAAVGGQGVRVVSLASPSSPSLTGSWTTTGSATDVVADGTRLLVANGAAGLALLDLSDPDEPTLIGEVDTVGDAQAVAAIGDFALVADGAEGLVVVSLATPETPQIVGTAASGSPVVGVDAVSSDLAVVAALSVIALVDISDPAAPEIIDQVDVPTGGTARSVQIHAGRALVAVENAGLVVLDFDGPDAPAIVTTTGDGAYKIRDIVARGDLAFGADYFRVNSVPVVSVANVDSPEFVDIVEFSSWGDDNGYGVDADDTLVVLGARKGGQSRLFVGRYGALEDTAGVAPAVVITAPEEGTGLYGSTKLTVSVEALDDVLVASVRIRFDGTQIAVLQSEPYTTTFTVPDTAGSYLIGAEAADLAGNIGVATDVAIAVVDPPTTDVVGRVVDNQGQPVAGALAKVDGLALFTESAADGTFLLAGLQALDPFDLVVQGTVGNLLMQETVGPFDPVADAQTDVGDIVLTTALAEQSAGPVVAEPVMLLVTAAEPPDPAADPAEATFVEEFMTLEHVDADATTALVDTDWPGVARAPIEYPSFAVDPGAPSLLVGVEDALELDPGVHEFTDLTVLGSLSCDGYLELRIGGDFVFEGGLIQSGPEGLKIVAAGIVDVRNTGNSETSEIRSKGDVVLEIAGSPPPLVATIDVQVSSWTDLVGGDDPATSGGNATVRAWGDLIMKELGADDGHGEFGAGDVNVDVMGDFTIQEMWGGDCEGEATPGSLRAWSGGTLFAGQAWSGRNDVEVGGDVHVSAVGSVTGDSIWGERSGTLLIEAGEHIAMEGSCWTDNLWTLPTPDLTLIAGKSIGFEGSVWTGNAKGPFDSGNLLMRAGHQIALAGAVWTGNSVGGRTGNIRVEAPNITMGSAVWTGNSYDPAGTSSGDIDLFGGELLVTYDSVWTGNTGGDGASGTVNISADMVTVLEVVWTGNTDTAFPSGSVICHAGRDLVILEDIWTGNSDCGGKTGDIQFIAGRDLAIPNYSYFYTGWSGGTELCPDLGPGGDLVFQAGGTLLMGPGVDWDTEGSDPPSLVQILAGVPGDAPGAPDPVVVELTSQWVLQSAPIDTGSDYPVFLAATADFLDIPPDTAATVQWSAAATAEGPFDTWVQDAAELPPLRWVSYRADLQALDAATPWLDQLTLSWTPDACNDAEGKPCDDGDACTTDTCLGAAGCDFTPLACDDGDLCTTDGCDPATGCTHPVLSCDDEDPCTDDSSCDPATGCVNAAIDGCCIDAGGCDDEDACTVDGCDTELHTCSHTPVQDALCCNVADDCDHPDPLCTSVSCLDSQCVVGWVGGAGCCVSDPYGFSFDLGPEGFTWQNIPAFAGWGWSDAQTAMHFGDADAGNYDFGPAWASLFSPPLTLQPDVTSVLSFAAWLDVEADLLDDTLDVNVHVGGEVFHVWGKAAVSALQTWATHEVDLSQWAGETVVIEWMFDSLDSDANTGEGVYVDDVSITVTCQ